MLTTKLRPPPVTSDHVLRKAVISRLEDNRHLPLTLISAPAGYGKSITISQWLDHYKVSFAWLSIDKEHNHIQSFLHSLLTACRMVSPGSMKNLVALIDCLDLPTVKAISEVIIEGIEEIREDITVVLDDYHLINNLSIHELINELLRFGPQNLHLVIITRRDPPLNLKKLRAYGQINELRINDLALTSVEVKRLLKLLTGHEHSQEAISQFEQITEGWIVGLRMIAYLINSQEDVDLLVLGRLADWTTIADFFAEEVLNSLPDHIQKLLLETALLDHFCVDIIDYIHESDIGKEFMEYLLHSNLFLIPLDKQNTWFRYHHIFRDVIKKSLQPTLSEDEIQKLFSRACGWMKKKNLYTEAIGYALEGNKIDEAIEIIDTHRHKLLNEEKFSTIQGWLQMLPEDVVDQQASLLLARAEIADSKTHALNKEMDLVQAEQLIRIMDSDSEVAGFLEGELKSIMSIMHYMRMDYKQSLADAEQALKILPRQYRYCHNMSMIFKTFSLHGLGQVDDGLATIEKYINEISEPDYYERARLLALKCSLHVIQGNIDKIKKTASIGRPDSLKRNMAISMIWFDCFLSMADYESNSLHRHTSYRDTILLYRYAGRPYFILHIYFIQVLFKLAQGNTNEVDILIKEIDQYRNGYNFPAMDNLYKAFQVEVSLRQNNFKEAWIHSKGCNFDDYPPIYFYYFPQLSRIKLLIYSENGDKKLAAKLLKKWITIARDSHNINFLIQALVLQSLLYALLEQREVARQTLIEVIDIARPLGYKRTFLDAGPIMHKLLIELDTSEDDEYLPQLILDFQNDLLNPDIHQKSITAENNSAGQELDPLSDREIQLLQMVSEGLRNKEIADKLFLSVDSIKKYLYLTYQKLGVSNRVQAIAKAKEKGYFSK